MRAFLRLAIAISLLTALTAPVWADTVVFVRFDNGMIVQAPIEVANEWVTYDNAVILDSLPVTYVNQPYTYYEGYPAFYNVTYWSDHHRHWRPARHRVYREEYYYYRY